MIRYLGLVACLLLAGAQDPADKVNALIQKLKTDNAADREWAAAELVKLGPPAIPAVRAQLDRARGSTRDILEKVLKKLELAERVAALMAPGPAVTLSLKDKPAADVLAEITRQSGITVEGLGLPTDLRVSLDVRESTVWSAIDVLCRAHGKLMYAFDADRIVIRPGAYRKLPAFDLGPYRFVVDAFDWRRHTGEPYRNFELHAGVLAPPGRFPDMMWIKIAKAEDESGASFIRPGLELSGAGHPYEKDERPPVIFQGLTWMCGDGPPVESTKLKSFQGTVHLRCVVERSRLVTLKNPLAPGEQSETQGLSSVHIQEIRREGDRIRLKGRFQRPLAESEKQGPQQHGRYTIALYDSAGRRLRAVPDDPVVEIHRDEGILRWADTLTFELPRGFTPDSLDLEEAAVTHTLKIPFNLDGQSLR